ACGRGRCGKLARECESGGARARCEARRVRVRRSKLARECEQRHWTGNTCLHCSSMGEGLIVFVKSDREPRILETASDVGAKSVPEPRTLEIVSDFGAKSGPRLRIREIVSDSGSNSHPIPYTPKTMAEYCAESDEK